MSPAVVVDLESESGSVLEFEDTRRRLRYGWEDSDVEREIRGGKIGRDLLDVDDDDDDDLEDVDGAARFCSGCGCGCSAGKVKARRSLFLGCGG